MIGGEALTGGAERRASIRRSPRLNRILAGNLCLEAGDEVPINVFLVDISSSGMRMNTDREIPDDQVVFLELPLDGFGSMLAERVRLATRVVWKKPLVGGTWVHGVEFQPGVDGSDRMVEEILKTCTTDTGRRRFRLNRLLPIALQLEPSGDWHDHYASDLSTGGLGARLRMRLERGREVMVRLHLEFGLPTVELRARVAWVGAEEDGRTETGLQFTDLDDISGEVLNGYIDRCLHPR